MKKLLSLILTVSLIFCFSACKEKDTSSEISSEPILDTSSNETSSVETIVSSQTQSSNTTSSSKKEDTSSDTTPVKEVYPEKVLAVYSFENQFKMPQAEKKTFYDSVSGNTLPYRMFIPNNYDETKKYPVILFLHGAGEKGTNNQSQLNNLAKMFKYNGDLVASAFLICPQSYEWWNLDDRTPNRNGTLSSALRLLEEIERTYSCDSNRIYVTGLSMGGYATWDLLENYGYKFAAGIPVCGAGNNYNGRAFIDIPIRIYHGTKDPTVNFSASQSMYNAIKNAGGQKVEIFPLERVGHNAWDPAYSDRDTFSWLLAQNKATNPNCDYEFIPYLKITDSSGATVISDEDIYAISYLNYYEEAENYAVDLILSTNGKTKLNQAYKMSNGSPFAFYCGTKKVYTFTATEELPDNIFSIRGIFDKIEYQTFFDTIEQVLYS